MHTQTHTHKLTHTQTHTHIHIYIPLNTHTNTHIHTHTKETILKDLWIALLTIKTQSDKIILILLTLISPKTAIYRVTKVYPGYWKHNTTILICRYFHKQGGIQITLSQLRRDLGHSITAKRGLSSLHHSKTCFYDSCDFCFLTGATIRVWTFF